jgi:hypothetical protein
VRKHSRIAELQDIFIVHLKRFEYDLEGWRRHKIASYFEFPLDFRPFTETPDDGEQLYPLTRVIVHERHAEAGHYYSFIVIDDLWYCSSDIFISFPHAHSFQGTVFGGNVTADNEGTGRSAYLLCDTRDGTDHNYFVPNSELIRRFPINLWETIGN